MIAGLAFCGGTVSAELPASPRYWPPQLRSPAPSGSQLRLVSDIQPELFEPAVERDGPARELRESTDPPSTEELPRPAAAFLNKSLNELTTNVLPPAGDFPPNAAPRRPLLDAPASRGWGNSLYQWQAPVLCHQRLYFEEVNLERYGYRNLGPLQPAASGAHFFGAVLALPYNLTSAHPCQCVYTLGHYRPGSDVPHQIHWPRRSASGTFFELGTIAGLILLVP